MKIRPKYVVFAILWPFLTTSAVILIFFLPPFLHCLDRGEERTDVAALADPDYKGSSNLILKAKVQEENAICLEETNLRYRTTSYNYFVPLASEEDTVKCILKLTGKELDDLSIQQRNGIVPEFKATLRNKLWEEPDDLVMDEFRKKGHIAENVSYAEMGPAPSYPLWVSGIVFLISLLGSYQIIKTYRTKPLTGRFGKPGQAFDPE